MIDRLSDDTNDSGEGDGAIAGCSKHVKSILYSDSNLEHVSSALRHSSISNEVFELLEIEKDHLRSKRKRKKENKSKRQ